MLKLTRRQIVCYMEKLNKQLHADAAFEAKLHGFKMSAPIAVQKWNSDDDKRLREIAKRRFDEMKGAI